MKKALIVSPYLDHLGGGERYMLSAAAALEGMGYSVYFSWDNVAEIQSLGSMLGITLKEPMLDPNIKKFYFGSNPLDMFLSTRAYNVVFYLSDGSLPLLGGRKNLVHMQVPFHGVSGKSLKNKLKKLFIQDVVVNSAFTKKVIDQEYGINSKILYPPVKLINCTSPKEKIILSVGRFEPSLNTKHQDILIDAWRLLSPKLPGWKLVLVGASASDDWLRHLQTHAIGLPVEFAVNTSYDNLCELYAKATIYWHAAGYRVDEVKNPELTEHFGISTVEALSAGCLPLVVPYGGQREIIKDTNFHWESIEELVQKTLINLQQSQLPSVNIEQYSYDNFKNLLSTMI